MFKTFLATAACLAALASSATAATRGFSIPLGGILINSQAAYGAAGFAGTNISLYAGTATKARFTVNYVLPPDYKANTTVKIRLYLSSTETTACSAVLKPDLGYRMRPNQPTVSISPLNDNITPSNGNLTVDFPVPVAGGAVIKTKTFDVKGPKSAAFTGQKAGDSLTMVFERQPDDPADTCPATISLRQVDVRYTAR